MRPYRRRAGVFKAIKVLKALSDSENDYIKEFNEENTWAKRLVNTRCRCSGPCCCNPRHTKWLPKKERITLQERKADISFKEQINIPEED